MPAAEPAPSVNLFKGSVSYSDRSCQGGLDGDYRPLQGAKVVAVRGNSNDSDRLGPDGDYKLLLDGSGPAQAWVILNSPTVQVGPNASLDGGPYKIPIRDLVAGEKNKYIFRDMAPAGAANIFKIASEGAALAAKVATPAKVPKVRLAWRYGHDLTKKVEISAADHTAYYPDSEEIILDGQHEWDPATILHEYGHHLMWSVADPGNQTAPSPHHANATYPAAPAAGLSEGFASAFAALIVGPNVKIHCRNDLLRLDSTPATTRAGPIDHPRLSQYNETRVAGTFWQIATYLEARDGLSPTKAFRQIVLALHNFKRVAGHPPHDMREVRDSLIAQGLQYNDPHQAQLDFDKIFAAQGLGWGVFATVEFADERSGGSGAWSEESTSSSTGPPAAAR